MQKALPLYLYVKLCDSVLDRLMQRVGGVAAASEQQPAAESAALPAGAARRHQVTKRRVTPATRCLYISRDGVLYPSRLWENTSKGRRRPVYQEWNPPAREA